MQCNRVAVGKFWHKCCRKLDIIYACGATGFRFLLFLARVAQFRVLGSRSRALRFWFETFLHKVEALSVPKPQAISPEP